MKPRGVHFRAMGDQSGEVETEKRPSTVSVLCCVSEHRRQVDFISKEGQTHLKCLTEAVKVVFSDVIGPNSELFLQVKSEVWKGEFIDIRETDDISNEAIVRAIVKDQCKVSTEPLKLILVIIRNFLYAG